VVTKTFKAESTIQTLQLVQEDLGADAIVISMREVPLGPSWNPWKKTSVEIVAASSDSLPELQKSQPAPRSAAPVASNLRSSENKNGIEFTEEMPEIEWVIDAEKKTAKKPALLPAKLKLNLDPMTNTSTPIPAVAASPKNAMKPSADEKHLPPSLKNIRQQLIDQGVDGMFIDGLINVALDALSPGTLADIEVCKKYITQFLGAELRVQQGVGRYVSSNVVCLIGTSGSGKTSTIAKLAIFLGQNLQKKITWVCADTIRMGAIAEARAYTDAMGFNLKLVYTPEDIKEILLNPEDTDLFLVDTPSYNPCDESQMIELGTLLAEIPQRCTYLAAPAPTKEIDLVQSSASLGIFNLDGLIITKLDETHTFGSVYNFARKNQVPLSYFTTGKEASLHLEVADPARLVSALFGKEWNK
jgi:flagellar biosynthesis protein FlhF